MNPIAEAYKTYSPTLVRVGEVIVFIDQRLEEIRLAYAQDFLVRWGNMYEAGVFPEWAPHYELGTRCYDNAMQLVALRPELIYVEGFLLIHDGGKAVPLAHAWCVTKDKQVVDPTRGHGQRKPGLAYFGVPIKADYSETWKKYTGNYGLLDGDPVGDKRVGIYGDPPGLWLDKR